MATSPHFERLLADLPNPLLHPFARPVEEAYVQLCRSIREGGGSGPIILEGEAGTGKTFLLRRLALESLGFHCCWVPFFHFHGRDARIWFLHLSEMSGLLRLATSAPNGSRAGFDDLPKPVLMLIDEAHRMPLETAEWLADTLRGHEQPVRVVMAGSGRKVVSERAAAFGSGTSPLHLPRLTEADVRDYMERLAAGPGLGPQDRRMLRALDAKSLAEQCGGVVRQLRRGLSEQVAEGIPVGMPPILRTELPRDVPHPDQDSETEPPSLHPLPVFPELAETDRGGVQLAEGGRFPGLPALGRGLLAWAYFAEQWWRQRDWDAAGDPTWPQSTVGMATLFLLGAVVLVGAGFLGGPEVGDSMPAGRPELVTEAPSQSEVTPSLPRLRSGSDATAAVGVSAALEPARHDPGVARSDNPPVGSELIEVQVNARPWARIEIDGQDFGLTPLARVSLPAGDHVFTAHFPGGRILRRDILVNQPRQRIAFP